MTSPDLTKSDMRPDAQAGPDDRPEAPARIGVNDLGRIDVEARAVEKIAALAASEVPDASGGVAKARTVPGAGYLGLRRSAIERLPKVSAEVDGGVVFLEVELSVQWPVSVARVSEEVRQVLLRRVFELVGLEVREVNITITDFITEAPLARVS